MIRSMLSADRKKIQIRSFVKGGNHGQYLQALGLRELLLSICPEAEVTHLNYNNHYLKEIKIQTLGGNLIKYLIMRYFWFKRFKFSPIDDNPDISIYGSDMIWHQESSLFPADEVFFGAHDSANKKIAYAPSVGYRGKDEPQWLEYYLSYYSGIGVRDENTRNLVIENTGKAPKYVIDPCFFLLQSKFSEDILSGEKNEFLSIYSTEPEKILKSFYHEFDKNKAPEFCQNFEYLGYFPRNRLLKEIYKQFTDPLWTVKRISQSKFLLTSTFHGVMMALMTQTPFIAVTSPNLEARLRSPISNTFGKFRLLNFDDLYKLESKSMRKYFQTSDFDYKYLNNYINDSKEWLTNILLK